MIRATKNITAETLADAKVAAFDLIREMEALGWQFMACRVSNEGGVIDIDFAREAAE